MNFSVNKKKVLKISIPSIFGVTLALAVFLYLKSYSVGGLLVSVSVFCIIPSFLLSSLLLAIFNRREIIPYLQKFWRYIPLARNLVSRDLKVKYRRSFLGFLWSILNPLLMALVISMVFSKIFGGRFGVDYFATYYLAGALIFNFMSEATSSCMGSILGAAPLIRKVSMPKYIFCMEKCVFSLINSLLSGVAILVIMLIDGCPFHLTILFFFFPMIYVFLFSFGLGLVLSAITVYFRDMLHLYSVFTTIWMYLTPVIYPSQMLEENGLGIVLKINPMYHYTQMFRDIVMYGKVPPVTDHLVCLSFALVMIAIGTWVFKKLQDRFILYI